MKFGGRLLNRRSISLLVTIYHKVLCNARYFVKYSEYLPKVMEGAVYAESAILHFPVDGWKKIGYHHIHIQTSTCCEREGNRREASESWRMVKAGAENLRTITRELPG